MVSTFTPNKNIEQPAHNDAVNTWDVPVNADWSQIDKAFGNSVTKNATGLSGNITLAVADYVPLTIIVSGAPAAAVTYVVPTGVGGQWIFANATTGGFNIGIKSNAGGTTINVPAGQNTLVSCDGSATGMRLSVTTTPVAAGSNTQIQFNQVGVLGATSNLIWDGAQLATTGLLIGGNATLGGNAGHVLTILGTAVAVPNNLNFDANTLFIDAVNNRVGIGTITPSSPLTVAGTIESTSGGIKFPDASVQTTAGAVIPGAVLDYIGTIAPGGWVFANGLTIGNGASGATGRANADTVNLFTLLWNSWANAQAPVSGGRGANAAADFAANKTIALPDLRGMGVSALDTNGGIANANRLSTVMASSTPGATGGQQTESASFSATGTGSGSTGGPDQIAGVDDSLISRNVAGEFHTHTVGVTVSVAGATNAVSNVQPTMVMSKIIKL